MNRTALIWTALILALGVFVLLEQDRPWKRLQADFRELELGHLRSALDVERRRTEESRRRLSAEVDAASRRLGDRGDEAARLERELRKARHSARWAAEELERLSARAALTGGAGEAIAGELREARLRLEQRRQAVSQLERQRTGLRSEIDAAEKRWSAEVERSARLEERIGELERGPWWRWPGLLGLDTSLAVVEVRPPGLFRETPAGRAGRVDRCMTCHLRAGKARGRDSEDAEAWPPPFAVHPKGLVGEDAPHPASTFGCTVCHGGNGRATDFSRAGHWPTSAGQEAEWVERWAFSRSSSPPDLILPPPLVEAGCARCHGDEIGGHAPSPGRVSLELGRRLVFRMGCAGCHAGDEGPGRREGPPLDKIASKTTPEWAYHWIAAPRRFRPTTWMPHLFSGESEEADADRRVAVIRAMVSYLWSRPGRSAAAAGEIPEGDAEAGSRVFASVGCTGCHLLDAGATRDTVALERLHGPNLARTGNKVRADWLYRWLLDPRSHRADTPMPDLRLSAAEAADLTAYLMASRDSGWEDLEVPLANPRARDALVLEHLEEELTLEESAERMAEMSNREKDRYLGRRTLRTYGCHGCHEIAGLGSVPAVAGPLTTAGATPGRWLNGSSTAVLAHRPRPGQPSAPDYGMSDREADAVLVKLLSFTPAAPLPRSRAPRREESRALEQGRRLLERYGCLGCHRLREGASTERGGAIAGTLTDPELRPPGLTSVGARLRPSWLFAYLQEPEKFVRRPWLTVRMPSFHWTGPETNDLVRFFAALDGAPLLEAAPPSPSKKNREVGRALVTMLQCRRCHPDSPDAADLSPSELSPSYVGASKRLRPAWVVDWILDPESQVPGTRMPVTFAKDAAGAPDSEYLTASISAPMFLIHRQRLLPFFESEEELLAFVADARQVSEALRDYLWSLE